MSSVATEIDVPVEETEAFQVLLSRAGRRTGKIPAEVVVRHVLGCVPPQEWPTRVEAMDAVVRRLESGRRDKLRVEARPAKGRLLGLYVTRRPGSGSRPYRTVLYEVDPIRGPMRLSRLPQEFAGHLQAHGRGARAPLRPAALLQQALKEQEWSSSMTGNALSWDPVRPLTGLGDWLERIVWKGDADTNRSRSARVARALKWFHSGKDRVASLKRSYADKPARRLELVEDLLRSIPAGGSGPLHDPALRSLLERERKRLRSMVEQALSAAEIREAYKSLKRTLYAYQREGVERFLGAGRLLLADDMGLGKTAQAIASCEILRRSGRVRRGLIIAPASLKPQWAREWGVFSELPIHVVDGTPEERQAAYDKQREGFLIINYEQLLRDLETVRRWDPDLVVLDERNESKTGRPRPRFRSKG